MTANLVLPPHDLLGPATPEAIADEERRLGWPLPATLEAFLLRHNGGWFYATMVRVFSVGDDVEYRFSRQNAEQREYDDDWPDSYVVFATDGGVGYYCYDGATRDAAGNHPLFYWSQEERRVEPIGTTFDDFTRHLESVARVQFQAGP